LGSFGVVFVIVSVLIFVFLTQFVTACTRLTSSSQCFLPQPLEVLVFTGMYTTPDLGPFKFPKILKIYLLIFVLFVERTAVEILMRFFEYVDHEEEYYHFSDS
jgi:hypothetical protein